MGMISLKKSNLGFKFSLNLDFRMVRIAKNDRAASEKIAKPFSLTNVQSI